jgi:hypothetical protein
VVDTPTPKPPVESFPKMEVKSTSIVHKPTTTSTVRKGFKINPKYALGALGASAVIGGGYLGYRALTNKDKKRK